MIKGNGEPVNIRPSNLEDSAFVQTEAAILPASLCSNPIIAVETRKLSVNSSSSLSRNAKRDEGKMTEVCH